MEDIKKYGDLSEQELLELLNSLEEDDDNLASAEESAEEENAEAEESSDTEEITYYSHIPSVNEETEAGMSVENRQDWWNLTGEEHRKRRLTFQQERQLLKARMRRAAFDQTDLPLDTWIEKDDVKELILRVTAKERECVERFEDWINKRVTRLLMPLLPGTLRKSYRLYPDSMLKCPGFMYTTKPNKDGEQKTFFITPSIPYYFEQGTEKDHIPTDISWGLPKLDQNIFTYYKHKERLARQEIWIASTMWNYNIHTCLDLLKQNVYWFAAYYEMRTGKVLLIDK